VRGDGYARRLHARKALAVVDTALRRGVRGLLALWLAVGHMAFRRHRGDLGADSRAPLVATAARGDQYLRATIKHNIDNCSHGTEQKDDQEDGDGYPPFDVRTRCNQNQAEDHDHEQYQ